MFVNLILLLASVDFIHAVPANESFKDQYCTDPRTMRRYAAYTEWADEYSCTRHRCQPGGRNLAIYTVGCKRVEAPESAIECEEVVEDTNMQFPYCCTRLRCLVVVRGEVWTRVLGQPWETLPAAPWSHMYKMKKPPPGQEPFSSKNEQGPIYELTEHDADGRDKVLRSSRKCEDGADCKDGRSVSGPDIVIALATNNDIVNEIKHDKHKKNRETSANRNNDDFDQAELNDAETMAEESVASEKPVDVLSQENFFPNGEVTQKPSANNYKGQSRTEVTPIKWKEEPSTEGENEKEHATFHAKYSSQEAVEKKESKNTNLQALVDAIGTRMRDIESVVQRMTENVHQGRKFKQEVLSAEKRSPSFPEEEPAQGSEHAKAQISNSEGEDHKRFANKNHGSKYLRADVTTDLPLYVEDNNLNGYFSDASNAALRRAARPKEPVRPTYMAPVDGRRKNTHSPSEGSEEAEKKHRKHSHKKKHSKGAHRAKKHHRDEKRKKFNRPNSVEAELRVLSLEDSGMAS